MDALSKKSEGAIEKQGQMLATNEERVGKLTVNASDRTKIMNDKINALSKKTEMAYGKPLQKLAKEVQSLSKRIETAKQVAATNSVEQAQKIMVNGERIQNLFDEHKLLAAIEEHERDTLKEEFNTQTRKIQNDLAALRERVQAEHTALLDFAHSLTDVA